MRLLIPSVAFLITIGGIFLFENVNSPKTEDSTAQIVETLRNNRQKKETNDTEQSQPEKSTPLATPPPILTGGGPTSEVPLVATNTPSVTPATATTNDVEPPASPELQRGEQAGHIFYTSSHWKSKYYYCDSDGGWKNLSENYLKSFDSEVELLKTYDRVLHEPCANSNSGH